MYPVQVETDEDQNIILTQEVFDLNGSDPLIMLSPSQAGVVASWIIEAALGESKVPDRTPVKFFSHGAEAEVKNMKVYKDNSGKIIIGIDEGTYIKISSARAKRLRDQLLEVI